MNDQGSGINHRNWKLKSAFERLVALLGFACILPILALLMVTVKLSSAGPVFYTSRRIGKGGREFTLYKLRSMRIGAPPILGADGKVLTLRADPRLTPIGKFLRLGFDELPQLINVIKGDMCLIGPRPDIPEELGRYSERQQRRLQVIPGITGLAAVAGGRFQSNAWNYEVDVLYVEHATWCTDLMILLLTVPYALGLERIGATAFRELLEVVRPFERANTGRGEEKDE